MITKSQTKKAKSFIYSVDLSRIKQVIDNINFNSREQRIIQYMLDKKTIKEIAIELNLSLSYVAYLKQVIYQKIYIYLELENKNN